MRTQLVGNNLRQRSLLNRQKGPDLVTAWTDYADYRGYQQQHHSIGLGENNACKQDQASSNNKDPAAADPVRGSRHPKGDRGIADQGEAQQ